MKLLLNLTSQKISKIIIIVGHPPLTPAASPPEWEGYLYRSQFQPAFIIVLSKVQCLVIEKIQEYLENTLGFDKYSIFKLKNSSAIAIIGKEEINNTRSLIRVRITNTNILTNYFILFLNNMKFITKKSEDFNDFKIICNAIYNGVHRNE